MLWFYLQIQGSYVHGQIKQRGDFRGLGRGEYGMKDPAGEMEERWSRGVVVAQQ